METMAASKCVQSNCVAATATLSPSTGAFLLHNRVAAGLSLRPSSPRFLGLLSSTRARATTLNVVSIHALDPDFYKIPYVEGVPVGKKLNLWNLPPNCKHSELLEWFAGVNVNVESLEFTDDPVLNAQGIGGFVELATKQDACIAIVRLDGYKFRGHYIRLDFAEKRPHRKGYGSRRNRSSGNSTSFTASSRPSLPSTSLSSGRSTSGTPQSASSYGFASASGGQGYDSNNQTNSMNSMSPVYDKRALPSGNENNGANQSSPGHVGSSVLDISPVMPSIGNTNPSPPSYNSLPTIGAQSGISYVTNYSSAQSAPHYSSGNAHPSLGHGNVFPVSGPQPAPSYATMAGIDNSTSLSSPQSSTASPGSGNTTTYLSISQPNTVHGSAQPSPGYGSMTMSPGSSQYNTANGGTPPSSGYGNMTTAGAGTLAPSGGANSYFSGSQQRNTASAPSYGSVPISGAQFTPSYDTMAGNNSFTSRMAQTSPSYRNAPFSGSGLSVPDGSPSSAFNRFQCSTSTSVPSYGPIPAPGNPQWGTTGSTPTFTSNNSSWKSASSYNVTGPSSSTTNVNQWSASTSTSGSTPPSVPGYSNSRTYDNMEQIYNYGVATAMDDHSSGTKGPVGLSPVQHEPIQTEVEPWSSNMNFRSGPMYGSPHPSSLNRVFVGNLAPSVDDAALHHLFSRFGTVLEARVLLDGESGRSRGVGVVAMLSVDEMRSASEALNGWCLESRCLKVNSVACRP